jgi:hypothetical protein
MDKNTVRSSDGSVDVSASVAKYTEALASWVSENEYDVEAVAAAVNTVLDANAGKRIAKETLVDFASRELGATVDTFRALTTRARHYVDGQIEAGLLFSVKGPGGGVSREAPAPKAPKTAKSA